MLLASRNWRGAGGVAVVLMLIGLAGLWVLSTPAAPEGARVRIVQPNIGQEEKWDEAIASPICPARLMADRTSTRLNSINHSHLVCLSLSAKKKPVKPYTITIL